MKAHCVAHLSMGARIVLVLALIFTLFVAEPAQVRAHLLDPVTWYVATTGLDWNSCTAVEAPCRTINGAIGKAAAGDTIKIAAGTYGGVLVIKDITLLGGWDDTFSAQTGHSIVGRVVIDEYITAVIDRFAISHGSSWSGGGIESDGTLTLSNSIISDNSAGGGGGGIYAFGPLTITDTTIQNNTAGLYGGGILAESSLTMSNSIVTNNRSGDGEGGGIYAQGPLIVNSSIISDNRSQFGGGIRSTSTVTISDTTIQNNTVSACCNEDSGGGGMSSGGGPITLNNTTISGNKAYNEFDENASGSGISSAGSIFLNNSTVSGNLGAAAIRNYGGTLTLNNSTITGNSSGISNKGSIYNTGGTTILRNSIIAGNTDYDCDGPGPFQSAGYNLIGRKTTGCNLTESTGDKIGTTASPLDPLLGALSDHGGPTLTHALHGGSPALNAGNPAAPGSEENACLVTDQRGVARPVNGACDIGAFEGQLTGVTSVLRLDPTPTRASTVRFQLTFSDSVTGVDTAEPFDDFSLIQTGITGASITTVSGSGSVYTVTLNTGQKNGALHLNILDNDSILDDSGTPLGGLGAGNADYTAGQTYTIRKIATPISPVNMGTLDRTPTYKWLKIPGATRYSYQVWRNTTLVYTKIVLASACGATTCQNTPTTLLPPGSYRWRARAMAGGTWTPFSPYRAFTVLAAKAGYWKGYAIDFFVTPDGSRVDDYSIYIVVPGCGSFKVTHTEPVPIANAKFKFTGPFYASGTFSSITRVSGQFGLYKFYIPECGYVSEGPFNWTATWRTSGQPDLAMPAVPLLLLPELDAPYFGPFSVDPAP